MILKLELFFLYLVVYSLYFYSYILFKLDSCEYVLDVSYIMTLLIATTLLSATWTTYIYDIKINCYYFKSNIKDAIKDIIIVGNESSIFFVVRVEEFLFSY